MPLPANGSRITPPFGVESSVNRYSISASGLTVAWSLPGPRSLRLALTIEEATRPTAVAVAHLHLARFADTAVIAVAGLRADAVRPAGEGAGL